ncbi:MAG TPA: c-type cytochrome [Gemmatimonadales bacterium]|nr:c-type cytochrome [Gemmatimonadales bacterium]
MDLRTRLGLAFGLVLVLQAGAAGSAAAQSAAPAGVTPAAIAQGDSIFHKTGLCYACHGSNAQGAVGPNLTDAEWIHGDGSYDFIVATVTSGIPAEKAKSGVPMPPKGGSSISDEDVKAVAAYVYSLSHK